MAQDNTNFDPLAPLGPSIGKFNMDVTNPLNLDPYGFKRLDIDQVKLTNVIPNYGSLTNPQRSIRDNVVGNPPNPPGPKKNVSFEESAQAADSYMRSIFQTNQDKNEYSRIFGYNAGPDGNNYYKRYAAYGSKKMDEVGFSPFRDNEAIYNERTTKWNDFTRMVNHSLLPGLWLGIKSGAQGTLDMLQGDFTSIDLNNAEDFEKYSNIGMSTKGGAFGFINNALNSFGLSAGIIIETIAEQAATKALEAGLVATGAGIPAAGALEATADASAVAKIAKVGKLFGNLDKAFGTAVKTLESSQTARNFWKAVNTPIGKFINPLGNTFDAMNDIRKAQAFGNLTSLAKLSKTAGGFYRDMKFINAAVTEAKLEGGMQQNKVYYDLYNLHYKNTGQAPSNKQMYDMMVQSEKAGLENLGWNTGVIYLSNKLVFPSIAGGKGTASILGARTKEILNLERGKVVFKTIKEEGKKLAKGEFTYVENGIRGSIKRLREDGFKAGFKNLSAKSVVGLGKYFKANIGEGLQENFQETISEALGNYYVNTFNSDAVKAHLYSKGAIADASRSKASYFKDAWANQNPFTKQGFETFATGFIMGAFASPINNLPNWASNGYNRMFRPEHYADYKNKKNAFGESIAETLTKLYNENPGEFFDSKLFNLGNQEILTKIIQEGGRKNVLDAKDFALVSQVVTALRSGTLDMFKERIESFRDLTPEEFEDAVQNIPKGEGLKYQSRIDGIVQRMNEIKTNYDKINDKYVNPIDISQYEKGTDAYKQAQLFSQAWEVAKMNAIFMGSSYQDAVKRMKDISTKIKSSKPLSKMTDSEIQLLLEPSRMFNERNILKEEIEAQKNVLSPEELRKKQNKLKALEALSEAYKNYDKFENNQVNEIIEKFKESGELQNIADENNISIDEAEVQLRKEINRTNRVGERTNENRLEVEANLENAYKEYLKAIANSTGDIYLSEEAEAAFEMILDNYKLGKESSILANYVNVLNNPRDFMDHVQRNYLWMNNLYNNRRDYFSNIVNQQLDNIELNALLNELADRNVYISEDEAAEFLRTATIPTEFYDDTRKVVIKEGHPEYDNYAIFFERAAAVRKLNPKGRSADNTALNLTLARLEAERKAALDALAKTEERVEKGPINIPKGTKATINDVDLQMNVGQYAEVKYKSGLRVRELILYKSKEGLRYNGPTGELVNKNNVKQGFEVGKKYTLELVADKAAIDKINSEFTEKKINAIQELTARAQSEKLTQASTFIPFTKNTKFELMDEALRKQLENAFNQYVEDTEGLADELSEVSDEKLLSALDDFVQNNPRAEKVIEQYNAKMKEKLAAQQLDEVEPPVMQVRGKDQDFKDLDVKDIKANIKKIEADIKKLKGKTDLTDQERENLAILEFNLALANKYLNYKLNFKESPKRSKVIKEVSKVIDQQGDITFDETTNQYTVNGNKLEKVNKEIERVISEKYQEKQRDQIAQIYNNTLAKNNSVDDFISELKKANLPGFTEDTYNELSEKLKALTGPTTTAPVSDIEAKKADIERRRQEISSFFNKNDYTTEVTLENDEYTLKVYDKKSTFSNVPIFKFQGNIIDIDGKKYINVYEVSTKKEYQNKKIATNSYKYILENLPSGVKGLYSFSEMRKGIMVPNIYKTLSKDYTVTTDSKGNILVNYDAELAALEGGVSTDAKADIEKELFSETDSKGRKVTVFSTTKEKDGLIKTTFTFNRSDKDPSQRNNIITGIPVEKALGNKYTIDEEYIPEGAKVIGVSEIRISKTGAAASVTFEDSEGNTFQGEVVLNSNTSYDVELAALEGKPTSQVSIEGPIEEKVQRRISLNDVLSLVNERVFEQKAETETYVTDQIKNFLADKEVKNDPTLLSQQAFDSLFGSKSILAELKEKANLGDIVIIPAKLTVFDIPAGVAGEINFLLVDREGNTTIVLVKMGDVNKWEEYDDETSDVSKKESYGLELVAAKNMLYNMTGINPKTVLLPLQISTDSATGRIETIESASPILVLGKIVAPVDPNQTTADGETLQIKINDIIPMRTASGEPVIEEVVDEEQATIEQEVEDIAAQQRRLAKENKIAILDKIQTLRSRQQKLDTDLKKINDILNYLDTIGNASIELTADELTDIINSITALDQVTGQYLKSKFRKGRGKTSIKNQDVRDQFRREFVVIAGVVGRLEDLRKEKEILTAQVKDLNDQIDYYQNILDTEDLALFGRSDIKIKIAEIKKKINSLNRSIKTINDTILRTKKLLKEYIDGIKKLDSQVGQQLQLIPDANYKPLSKEEVERLEEAVDNLENATLEDFNSIVKQFKNLRSRLSATMDVAELTPKVKELEIERINSLQESLKSYNKEVRYLNDILNEVSKESIANKLSDKNSNGPKPTNTKNTSSTNKNKLDETIDKSKGDVVSEISLGEILSLAERPVKESVISEKGADIISRINKSTVDEIKEMLKDVSDLTAYEVKVINDAAKSRIKSLTEEFKSEIKDQMNDIQETQYVTIQPIDDIPAGSLITITSMEGDNITFEVANSNEKKSVKFDNLNGKIMTQEEAKSKSAVEKIEITPEAKSKIIESITAADSLTNADIDNIIAAVKDKDLDTLEEELYNKKIC
jgi:hypothetical protein